MNRLRAKAGNFCLAFAAAACFACATPSAGLAAGTPEFWFAGTRLIFENLQERQDEVAVATSDSGLARFLGAAGAAVAYQPGQDYIVVTTADRRTINFTLGDAQFTVNGVTQVAPFAPYVSGRDVFLPFLALAKALYIDAVADGTTTILQPQLGSLDVRTQARTTVVTLRSGTALHFKRLSGANEAHVALEFEGVGSTLEPQRRMPANGALRGVAITASGAPRNPVTIVDIDAVPGSVHALLPSESRNAIAIAFAPAGVALAGSAIPAEANAQALAVVAPQPPPLPVTAKAPLVRQPIVARVPNAAPSDQLPNVAPSDGPNEAPPAGAVAAQVTGFKTTGAADDGVDVDVALTGTTSYEWHRLGDNRWYVDLKPATLTIPSQDVPLHYQAMPSMRLKSFVGPHDALPTVRIALSLDSPRTVTLSPSPSGLALQIGAADDSTLQHVGYGQIGSGSGAPVVGGGSPAAGSGVALAPPPVAPVLAPAPESTWKFGPQASYNSRLIVIDPGHGGSDAGSQHFGLTEKTLNLDVGRRLRDLLVSRGWVVKMTRQTDVDVYQPNDSARDELQARCDVANAAGARFFISIHTNAFTSAYQHGTTTYFYQAQSYGLASAVHERLAATLPTTDDGVVKENFYVIHHTKMPSILIEMAFDSNPTDAEYLHSNAFLQKVALGIADGVGNYASSPSQPVSTTDSDTPAGQ